MKKEEGDADKKLTIEMKKDKGEERGDKEEEMREKG